MTLPHFTNGQTVGADDLNNMVDAINALVDNAMTIGGTVGSTQLTPTFDSGEKEITPDAFGNIQIDFNVEFASAPSVWAVGNSGRPNTLVTPNHDSVTTTGFSVHCQDTTNNVPVTNGTVNVFWGACQKTLKA